MTSCGWLADNGWLLRPGDPAKPTHLLLDGGRARVSDDSAGAFLNAYAIAVVKDLRPCIVELRTPVFRLFLDLDVLTAADSPLDRARVMSILQQRAIAFFATDDTPRAAVCTTAPKTQHDGHVKAGLHVIWTNVWATSAVALAFRAAVVEDLDAAMPDACAKPWAKVVDACVFTANGLRMPFSEKGRGGAAVYAPAEVWAGDAVEAAVGEVGGVSAVRRWVRELSIRSFGVDETPLREGVEVSFDASEAGGGADACLLGTSVSLKPYEAALRLLDAALPVQYAGQRFTGVIKAENCFLLRSTSRYCENAGRSHTTCNIYFTLTLKGIRQMCYCRCDTAEGRKYGMCKDFKGAFYPVPDEALAAFFGVVESNPHALPSTKTTNSSSLVRVLSMARPPVIAKARRRR